MRTDQAATLVLLVLQAIGTGIVAADPQTLGLPAVTHAWIAVGMLGVSVSLAFMRRLWPNDVPTQ